MEKEQKDIKTPVVQTNRLYNGGTRCALPIIDPAVNLLNDLS